MKNNIRIITPVKILLMLFLGCIWYVINNAILHNDVCPKIFLTLVTCGFVALWFYWIIKNKDNNLIQMISTCAGLLLLMSNVVFMFLGNDFDDFYHYYDRIIKETYPVSIALFSGFSRIPYKENFISYEPEYMQGIIVCIALIIISTVYLKDFIRKYKNTIVKIILMFIVGIIWYALNQEGHCAEIGPEKYNRYISCIFSLLWIVFLIRNRNNIAILITSLLFSLNSAASVFLFVKIKSNHLYVDPVISKYSGIPRVLCCGFDYENYFIGEAEGLVPGIVVYILLSAIAAVFIVKYIVDNYEIKISKDIFEAIRDKHKELLANSRKEYIANVLCILFLAVILLCTIHKTDKEMINQLFEINVRSFGVIEVDNNLQKSDYEGIYKAKLTLQSAEIVELIKAVEEEYYLYDSMRDGYTFIENLTGRNWNDKDVIYESYGNINRNLPIYITKNEINNSSRRIIVISEMADNECVVEMFYIE